MKDLLILKQYISNILKYPRISIEEEKELARKIRKGDKEALNKLVHSNLKLVVKIALDLCRGNGSIMDIIQNGNMGLMKAAEKFNPDRGVRFSTYSAYWIKQAILRGFVKPSMNISISYRKDEINKKIKNYIREKFAEHGEMPTIEEITTNLKVKRRDALDVALLCKGNGGFFSNNASIESVDDILENIQDNSFNPEVIVERNTMREDIQKVIESFPPREREIIKKRFGFNIDSKETLHSLGCRYSISAEATRQIEKKVLSRIKWKFPYLSYYFFV